jgi:hypothetical protein
MARLNAALAFVLVLADLHFKEGRGSPGAIRGQLDDVRDVSQGATTANVGTGRDRACGFRK